MENLFVFLATSLVLRTANSRFRRYAICPGCSSYLNTSARRLHIRRTKDGDTIYFNEYTSRGVTYGMVCVQMSSRHTERQSEKILVNYMNRARKPMHIAANSYMEIVHEMQHLTITDYWQDKNGIDWKVKGYTNGKIVALLYVKNISDTSVSHHDAYLDGFRFSSIR